MGDNCCRREFVLGNFGLSLSEPKLLISPQCSGKKRLYFYVAWRAFWAFYHTFWTLYSGIATIYYFSDPIDRLKWLIYLTHWTYVILALDSIIQLINVVYCIKRRPDMFGDSGSEVMPEMPWYLKAQWVIYNIASVSAIEVTILFWVLLYGPSVSLTPDSVALHALNTVYVFLNLFVTATPTRLYHFFHTLIFGIVFMLFTVVYYYAGGTDEDDNPYIYGPLNWNNPGTAALYGLVSVLVIIPVLHAIYFGLYKLSTLIPSCQSETETETSRERGEAPEDVPMQHVSAVA